jgi:transcriptional regulator with XRE-family HTH domain
MEELKRLRKARGLSQAKLAALADLDPSTVSQIETGARRANSRTLERLAAALGVEVRDLFPLGQVPLPDFEEGRPSSKPLSPELRRRAAWARRAELERTLQHLTLRLETIRDQAKMHYEAGAAPEDLWPLFMDSVLLARGAEGLLLDNRIEAEELGFETEEERRLRDRLKHRTEDAEDAREKIGDMWHELLNAKADAEMEALRKELSGEAETPDRDNVQELFRRDRAV